MGNCKPSRLSCMAGRSYDSFMERQIEQHREEGQALLRSMVVNSEEIDWFAVINKANELHTQEQAWLRQRNTRQERALFVKTQKKALRQRKRYDVVGSFSVNMLTFRMDEEPGNAHNPFKHISGGRYRTQSSTSEGSSPTWHSRDDQSNFSNGTEEYIQSQSSNDRGDYVQTQESNDYDQSNCSVDTEGCCIQSKSSSVTTDYVNVLNRLVSEDTMDPIDEHSERS